MPGFLHRMHPWPWPYDIIATFNADQLEYIHDELVENIYHNPRSRYFNNSDMLETGRRIYEDGTGSSAHLRNRKFSSSNRQVTHNRRMVCLLSGHPRAKMMSRSRCLKRREKVEKEVLKEKAKLEVVERKADLAEKRNINRDAIEKRDAQRFARRNAARFDRQMQKTASKKNKRLKQ